MPGKALHVRGGKFLPAEPVATFGAAVSSVNAAMVALSPGKTCELYGLPKSDLTEWIVENAGHVLAGTATMMWLALNGMSVEKTIGFGIVPFLVVNAKNILLYRYWRGCSGTLKDHDVLCLPRSPCTAMRRR